MAKEVKVKPLTKREIFQTLADNAGIKRVEAENFVNELLALAYKECKDPKGFVIPGLGKLMLKDRKARMGRNPATGESIKIKAKKVLKFRIAKAAKIGILGETPKKVVVPAKALKKIKK